MNIHRDLKRIQQKYNYFQSRNFHSLRMLCHLQKPTSFSHQSPIRELTCQTLRPQLFLHSANLRPAVPGHDLSIVFLESKTLRETDIVQSRAESILNHYAQQTYASILKVHKTGYLEQLKKSFHQTLKIWEELNLNENFE